MVCAQRESDSAILHALLNEEMITLHDVNTTLKLLCITEWTRLPVYMLEHITMVKQITEKTIDETALVLREFSN